MARPSNGTKWSSAAQLLSAKGGRTRGSSPVLIPAGLLGLRSAQVFRVTQEARFGQSAIAP